MRPKGTERTKRKKRACKRKKKERKGEKKMKGGSLTGGRKYAPKGNGKDEKEKKERAKGKRKREKAERMIKSKPKEDGKKDGRRMHLCERHRKIATHLPQNYTFVFNSKDVWRKHANLSAFT